MIRDPDTLTRCSTPCAASCASAWCPPRTIVAETDEIPDDIVAEMKALGLFGLTIPEAYGGLGLTMEEEALVMFELGQTSPAFRSLFGTNVGIGSQGILIDGTPEQKEQYLPRLATGELIASFALTEPEAGSDAASLRTTARARRRPLRPQRHQALHHQRAAGRPLHADGAHRPGRQGRRRRLGLHRRARHAGPHARQARQEDGPARRPHLRRDLRQLPRAGGQPDRRRGRRGLQDRDEGAGQGPPAHRRGLRRRGRAHAATTRCATRWSASSSASRSPSSSWSRRCSPTARTELYAARMHGARRRAQARRRRERRAPRPSCCKFFASEMCGRVADRAVQIFGGAGYVADYGIERFYRDVRLFRIYEGTSQIQQLVIARNMIRAAG